MQQHPSPAARRSWLCAVLAWAVAPALHAAGAEWPVRPVRIVVPAPAGSSLDAVARLLGARLQLRWHQPVVVDNKPGAGGLLGMDAAAKAAPDGHTLALGFNGPVAFAPFLYKHMPYDPARDLAPVVMTTLQANVLAVNAALPVRTPAEFVAYARQRDGRLNFASVGQGSSSHLTMELLLAEAGVRGTHVPYNGSPAAALSVAGGETDALVAAAPALLPLMRSGKLRLLAVTGRERMPGLKDLPTLVESGLTNVEAMIWNGLFVASATPEAVVDRINADVNAVLAEPAVRAALDEQGLAAAGGSVAAFRQQVAGDTRRWGALIQRLGLQLD